MCVVLGTRGDVQPIVALADGLLKEAMEVTICAPPENEEFISGVNCRFVPFGPESQKSSKKKIQKTKGRSCSKNIPKGR